MASGTRLARSKIAEDDFFPKRKTIKLDKLNAPSPLKKKLGSTGKKVTESPLRRSVRTERFESSSASTNSKNHSSSINSKNKKGDRNNRPSGTLDKLKKNVSPQTRKRKADGKSASSSTEDSGASTSKNKKKRKLNGKNIASGVNDAKGEASGKKKVRKTLDVRTYKRLLTGQAGGRDGCLTENKPLQEFLSDLGENCSRIQEGGDIDRRKGDVCDAGDTGEETLEPLAKDLKKVELPTSNLNNNLVHDDSNQDNGTKLGMFKDKQRNQHDTLVESSEKVTLHDEAYVRNIESPQLNLEELDVTDGEICYDNCTGKTSKIDLKERLIHSHTTVIRFPDICLVCKQRGQLVIYTSSRWCPPPRWLKANIDASYHFGEPRAFGAAVVRDAEGQFLSAAGDVIQARSPLQAEVQTVTILRQALLTTGTDFAGLIVEGDCLGAVRRLRRLWERTQLSRGADRHADPLSFLLEVPRVIFSYRSRCANRVADFCAFLARQGVFSFDRSAVLPRRFLDLLAEDTVEFDPG